MRQAVKRISRKNRKRKAANAMQNMRSAPQWATHISALRQRLNVSQTELGLRLSCSSMTVSRWERGLLEP